MTSEDIIVMGGGIPSPDEEGVALDEETIMAVLEQSERQRSRELRRLHEKAEKKRKRAHRDSRKRNRK
jgi:hypothetical protein